MDTFSYLHFYHIFVTSYQTQIKAYFVMCCFFIFGYWTTLRNIDHL